MGLIAGLIGGLKPATIFDSFIEGAKAVTFGALIVGFARAITVVLEQGKLLIQSFMQHQKQLDICHMLSVQSACYLSKLF